jgi:hypothetical protein
VSEIQETKKYFAEHPEVVKPVLLPAAETLQTAATEDESTRRQWPDPPAEEAFSEILRIVQRGIGKYAGRIPAKATAGLARGAR